MKIISFYMIIMMSIKKKKDKHQQSYQNMIV